MKPLGSRLKLPSLRTKTVGQFFELPKNKNVEQVFQLPKTNLLCNCLRIPRRQVLGSYLNFPRPESKTVCSCLKLSSLRTETVDQLFELPKNTNVGQLFELPMTQIQVVGLFFFFLESQDYKHVEKLVELRKTEIQYH